MERRADLLTRKDELAASAQSIQELVEVLDQRKDEAIQRTFRQVSKNFSDVFAELVPTGGGRLIMQRLADGAGAGTDLICALWPGTRRCARTPQK